MRRPISVSPEVPLQTMLRDYWDEIADVAAAIDIASLERVAVMLLTCQARGRVIFVVGNGGSAATASHFACDLSKGTRRDGPPTFHVVSLTDNVPLLTAWANDSGYERVFSEQLTALARPGDLLVAIRPAVTRRTSSPRSPQHARAAWALSDSRVAQAGGCAHLADVVVNVPSDRIEVVEDAHLVIAHSLCVTVRERLASGETPVPTTSLSVVPARRAGR